MKRKFSCFYDFKVETLVFCPLVLSKRGLGNCSRCKYFEGIHAEKRKVKCSYPYPDKGWFWKRQLDPNYPKKLKVSKNMPYIRQKLRNLIDNNIRNILEITNIISSDDEDSFITYIFYRLILRYSRIDEWDYKAKALKVLEDVKLEYYDKILKPHAKKKIKKNGDIVWEGYLKNG